ncbi:uncharacterized protein LOC117917942 isoform X2 [Vitis riparia]|uniref:uncharacterized protein LOC117917942 isoform X2 n=1 Tax=Vitis riparia TaxID=96939 RepID=UPI00155A6EAA|nr:uncharacterized protein LOC117917942 isoform X2 [Vitis riparia]
MAFVVDTEQGATGPSLISYAMQGKWEKVVDICKEDPWAHDEKTTTSGDTALHIAVSDGREDVVVKLVQLMAHRNVYLVNIKNDRGNTPLHLAASVGNVRMCKCIAAEYPELVGVRNNENETPLFLTALHGMKDAFLCLSNICSSTANNKVYEYLRRSDGENSLHCAITGEYFDLAFTIIHEYPDLVNYVNERGISPLHLLASKATLFRSGTRLNWFDEIIYLCVPVKKLLPQKYEADENPNHTENFYILTNLWNMIKASGKQSSHNARRQERPHPNYYGICYENFIKLVAKAWTLPAVIVGSRHINKIKEKKEKHTWSVQIMDEMLKYVEPFEYDSGSIPQLSQPRSGETVPYDQIDPTSHWMVPGKRYKKVFDQETSLLAYYGEANPDDSESEEEPRPKASAHHSSEIKQKEEALKRTWGMGKRKSPVLIAAENGIIEMVEKILKLFPAAIRHVDSDQKNIVLLAVKNRQISVYELLLNRKPLEESAFRMVDSEGNSALHLAATLGDYRPYPFAALQMQWEIKWYKYVKNSVPRHFFIRYNNKNQVPKEIFTESHKELVREGGKWLNNTSNSCSVVATLVTTVAFATTATIPGGFKENSSEPTLQHHPGFLVYAISSLIALSFSVTSVVTFLAILTSRYQVKDFGRGLPRKLLLVACLPVTFFAVAQFPFYFDLIWAIFKKVPQRTIYG